MLKKKSFFKPKTAPVRRPAGPTPAPNDTERLSKTPAPAPALSVSQETTPAPSQSQRPPPQAPSAPSSADKTPEKAEPTPPSQGDRPGPSTAPPTEPTTTAIEPTSGTLQLSVEPQRQEATPASSVQHTPNVTGLSGAQNSPTESQNAVSEPEPAPKPAVVPAVAPRTASTFTSLTENRQQSVIPLSTLSSDSAAVSDSSTSPPPNPTPEPPPADSAIPNAQGTVLQGETAQIVTPPADNAASGQPEPATAEGVAGSQAAPTSAAPRPGRGRKRRSDTSNVVNGEGSSEAGTATPAAPPKKRPRIRKAAPLPGEEGYQTAAEKRAAAAVKRARKRKSPSENDGAAEITEAADEEAAERNKKMARHAREITPEDAEAVKIDIAQVKMADLIKDMRVGKKFSLHDELMERERMKRQKQYEKRRQQKHGDEADGDGDNAEQSGTPAPDATPDGAEGGAGAEGDEPAGRSGMLGPAGERYQIINGEIVVDSRSLQVDRHARAAQEAGELEEHEENDFTHHTTTATYLRRKTKPQQWTDEETDKFFWALSAFGTDFDTISRMFPGKSRKHVKLKFNREERASPARISDALVGRKKVGMDMDEYKRATGKEYQTAEAIYAEQKEAEDKFEAEQRAIAEAKAEEERLRKEALFGNPNAAEAEGQGGARKKKGRGRKKMQEATW